MLKRIIHLLRFGKKETNTSSSGHLKHSAKDTPSSRYYRSIKDLPLYRYVDCKVNGNRSALIIAGEPSKQQLAEAWYDIEYEYADAQKNAEYINYLNLQKETTLLEGDYHKIQMCAQMLEAVYGIYFNRSHPNYEDAKKSFDFFSKEISVLTDSNYDFNDQSNYHKNIKRCINRSKGTKIQWDIKLQQLAIVQRKFAEDKPVDEEYYASLLISISDHCGYQLTDRITVLEFCNRLKRLSDGRRTFNNLRRQSGD